MRGGRSEALLSLGPEEKNTIKTMRQSANSDRYAFGIGNAKPEYIRELYEGLPSIRIYRDPREMLISAYYSHKLSHPLFPGLEKERAILQKVDFQEGIEVVMQGIMRSTFESMLHWPVMDQKKHLELSLESISPEYTEVKSWLRDNELLEEIPFTHWPKAIYNQIQNRYTKALPPLYNGKFSDGSFDANLTRLKKRRKKQMAQTRKTGEVNHSRTNKKHWSDELSKKNLILFDQMYPGLVDRYGIKQKNS